MPKYCSSCGTTNNDNMTNCVNCGAVLDNYNQVYPANGSGYSQTYNQPYAQPYQQQAYSVPNSAPYTPPTSVMGWIGWMLLCSLFPLIGQLIMLTSRDQSAKNFAKAQLILVLLGIILVVVLIVVGGVSLDQIAKEINQ